VYGREQLGPFWGYLAGWGFVVGKIASCAAMALTVGAYVWPAAQRPLAVAAVVALTAVNYHGVHKTALLTRLIVVVVLGVLTSVVFAALFGGEASISNLDGATSVGGLSGVLRSAGLLFFAFAGYARLATLGEEVVDPQRTIPRAIPLALGIALAVYVLVAVSVLLAVGPQELAASTAPLDTAVRAGRFAALSPLVRIGGAIAALGVLLSLIVGVSRTVFAMAVNGEMPRTLGVVHPRYRVPHRAELAVGAVVVAVVLVTDLRGAVGFSSFSVLSYYAITNASAYTLRSSTKCSRRGLSILGLIGCVALAFTLPSASVRSGLAVLGLGLVVWLVQRFARRWIYG
jgi:APA family basic amino acid/polyamine antiporter